MDTAWCADNDMYSLLENLNLIADNCASNAGVDLHSYEFTNLLDDESDLLSELSCGSNHKCLSVNGACVDNLQN